MRADDFWMWCFAVVGLIIVAGSSYAACSEVPCSYYKQHAVKDLPARCLREFQ